MTSVPPTQPPAAPEADVNALVRAGLRKCRVEDGSPVALIRESDLMHITHMVVTELVPLLADLTATRERLRVVEGERDALRIDLATCQRIANGIEDRAESAEAAHRALQAAVEALADAAEARERASLSRTFDGGTFGAWIPAADLRALLAG